MTDHDSLVENFSITKPRFDSLKDDFRMYKDTKEALLAIGDSVEYPEPDWTRSQCAEWWKKMGPIFADVMKGWSGEVPDEVEAAIDKMETTVDGVSARVLKKKNIDGLPVIVYLHGGGFATWSFKDGAYDNYLSRLAALGKCIIVAVDYVSSADKPYPAGLEDCVKVTKAAIAGDIEGVPAGRVCVAGDSSGGNLAVATAFTAKKEDWSNDITGIYTICPYLDGEIKAEKYPSMMEFDGYFCSKGFLIAVVNGVVEQEDQESWSKNPLLWSNQCSDEELKGFPPTKTIVMQLDMIRDMGVAFHYKLQRAGVEATLNIVSGGVHEQQLFTLHAPEATQASIHDLAHFVNYVA